MKLLIKLAFMVGFSLVITGITLVAFTSYREPIEEVTQPHMEPITKGYEWRSTNPTVSTLGVMLLLMGVLTFLLLFFGIML